MSNIVKTELKILLKKTEANCFYVKGLNLQAPSSNDEKIVQTHMVQAIFNAADLLKYLISCFDEVDQDIYKIKEMRDVLKNANNAFDYIDKHILVDNIDIDTVFNLDTQIVYAMCKTIYQSLYRIPELQRVLDLLSNFSDERV